MILVLAGGKSSERKISLESGEKVSESLSKKGYKVSLADYSLDQLKNLDTQNIQLIFIAFHGGLGENGSVQAILEKKKIPFTGSSSKTCQLFFDKEQSKNFFQSLGITTPPFEIVTLSKKQEIPRTINFPFIVKPRCEGSSIGVSLVLDLKQYKKALKKIEPYDQCALLEELIVGREMTLCCLGKEILNPIEIICSESFFDYDSKYHNKKVHYICNPLLNDQERSNIKIMAEQIIENAHLKSFFRIDFILSHEIPFVLEVNTVPGISPKSLLARAYQNLDKTFEDLCVRIVENELKII